MIEIGPNLTAVLETIAIAACVTVALWAFFRG